MAKIIAVGQAGGPSAVINDTLAGTLYEAKLRKDIKVIGLRNGLEGGGLNPDIQGNLVDLTRLDNIQINSLRGIPGAYLGTTRLKLKSGRDDDKIKKIRTNLDRFGVDCFFYIGGNDSADVVLAEGRGIHVAKTIDNDLQSNDHTPGWGSASLSNISTIRALNCDLSGFNPRVEEELQVIYSNAPVVVYQTQGRDTGWLTLGCAFAKLNCAEELDLDAAPHFFLPREIPFDQEILLKKLDNRLSRKGYAVIVCSEELVDKEGRPLSEVFGSQDKKDEHGHAEHGRAGSFNYATFLANLIKRNLKADVASNYLKVKETPISPQHIQRCLMRSQVDAQEAFELGRAAVSEYGDNPNNNINFSMGLQRKGEGYNITPVRIPLEQVAAKVRRVNQEYLGNIDGPSEKFYEDFLPVVSLSQAPQFLGPELTSWKR